MKNSKKRGFTIVELVIVIAVIAILAGVLIPTFVSVINKANVSSDTALVRGINEALAIEGVTETPTTMHQALQNASAYGYTIEKLTPRSSGDIVWNSETNHFALVDKDGNTVYSVNGETVTKNAAVWKIAHSKSEISEEYSNYIAYAETGTLNVGTGVDVGSNAAVTAINYTGSATGESVVIRTNGGKLTIDAENDHVEHYGIAREVVVSKVSDSTYVEHGTVAKMTVEAGAKNVVIKSTAVVVEVDNKSANLNNEGGYIMKLTEGSTALKSGAVTTGNEISVGSYDQLQGLALSSTLGNNLDGKTIKLTADIDMTGKTWTPFGFRMDASSQNAFSGTIDGQGHKIVGLSNGTYQGVQTENTWTEISGDVYGFIAYTKGAVVVKNITFADVDINSSTAKVCGVVVGDTDEKVTTSLTLENIKVTGSVVGKDKVAGLVGYLKYVDNATISNCAVEATVSATASETESYRAGGLFGYVSSADVSVESCSYKGNVAANNKNGNSWCGLLASGFAGDVNMTVKGSTFEGSATTVIKDSNVPGCTLNGQYVIGALQVSSVNGETALSSGTFSIEYTTYTSFVSNYYTITQGD